MHGWGNSTRRLRLPPDWHARRARTWRAARGQCQHAEHGTRCTWVGRLNGDGGQCDHIEPGDNHNQTNLQWLCPTHHKHKTITERPSPPTRHRTPEPHPGRRT